RKGSDERTHPNGNVRNLWKDLDSDEHWVRYAARVELEKKPAAEWSERALTEKHPAAALTALLALSRAGDRALQSRIVQRIDEFAPGKLDAEQQLIALRALGVCFIRMGQPDRVLTDAVLARWEATYPTPAARGNQSLCELLVYLGAPSVVNKTIPMLASAKTQQEKFHYLFTLRLVTNDWTLAERKAYFDWLGRARTEFNGANMLPTALNYIRADAEATLASEERVVLKESLA